MNLGEMGGTLWRSRKFIVLVVVGAAVVSAAVSLVLPRWYRAEISILPPESSANQSEIGTMMRLAGFKPAYIPTSSSQSAVYGEILASNRVADAVIDSLDLIRAFKVGGLKDARKRLSDNLRVSITEDALIKIAYDDRDKARAARTANALVQELDRFNQDTRVTTAKKVRAFIERRLAETGAELDSAQTSLEEFKRRTGAVFISDQAKASIETAAGLYARIAELEVTLERLQLYATDKSPEVIDVRSQIRAFQRKLAEMGYMGPGAAGDSEDKLFPNFENAPLIEKQLADLTQTVEVKRSVYGALSEQYEDARIQETRDTPTIQVLDWAQEPFFPAKPRRKVIVSVSAVAGLFLASLVALVREGKRRNPGNPLAS